MRRRIVGVSFLVMTVLAALRTSSNRSFTEPGSFAIYDSGAILFRNGTFVYPDGYVRYGWFVLDANESHAVLRVTLNASGYDRVSARTVTLRLSETICVALTDRLWVDQNSGKVLGRWVMWMYPWEIEKGKETVMDDWFGIRINVTLYGPRPAGEGGMSPTRTKLGNFPRSESFQASAGIEQNLTIGDLPSRTTLSGTMVLLNYHLRTGLLLQSQGRYMDDVLYSAFGIAYIGGSPMIDEWYSNNRVIAMLSLADTNVTLEGAEQPVPTTYYLLVAALVILLLILGLYVWIRWFRVKRVAHENTG